MSTRSDRLQELSLFITAQAVSNDSFTPDGLRDVLFLLDALSVAELGHPITGFSYRKAPSGPQVPDIDVSTLSSDLISVQIDDSNPEGYLVALRPGDLSIFSAAERELIERVVKQVKDCDPQDRAYYTYGWMSKYQHAPEGFPVPADSALIFT